MSYLGPYRLRRTKPTDPSPLRNIERSRDVAGSVCLVSHFMLAIGVSIRLEDAAGAKDERRAMETFDKPLTQRSTLN